MNTYDVLFEIAGPLRVVRAHRTMKLRCNATFVFEMVPQGLLPLVISSTLLASITFAPLCATFYEKINYLYLTLINKF